jgi:dolichol kinase
MKERLKREVMRKSFHMTGVTVPIAYLLFGKDLALLYSSIALLAFVFLEFIRIRVHSLFPLAKTADIIERKWEKNTVAASVYFCVAAVISVFFLDQNAVIVGLTAGLLSDTAAALVGVGWGKHELRPGKTLEGTVAGIIAASLVAFFLNSNYATVIAIGLIFLAFDLLDLGVDDNFTTPLAMVLAVHLLEGLL